MPVVIGFCEVENKEVLEDLADMTNFKDNRYEVIHRNSPDARGIDVAAMYQRKIHFTRISLSDQL